MARATDHGFLDRVLHRVAFASTAAQCGGADLEDRLFRRELAGIEPGPPVLVTALPRAGTTILLELLAGTPTLASHLYRDMPFALCPMMWRSMSAPFARTAAPRERMHGDGIQISHDSPEAFEEIVWRRFWPDHYGPAAIEPWSSCLDPEFGEFFASHMRKIIALRARDKPTARRYLSKNNANIGRLPALLELLPEVVILVLFREPMQHATSLWRQHLRFCGLHREDPFTRRYMAAIGHFDFGANLKPIDFDGWLETGGELDPMGLAFWLRYWCATYRHVLSQARHPRVHLIRFETLTADADLSPLAEAIGVDPESVRGRQGLLRPAAPQPLAPDPSVSDLLATATPLYHELQSLALLP